MAKRTFEFLVLAALVAAGHLGAATGDFIGKWKLNSARSQFVDQMKVEASGPNTYVLNFAGNETETVVADGTDQPGLAGTRVSVSIEDPRHWKVVRKLGDRTLLVALWTLAEDGKTLRDNFTSFGKDGAAHTVDFVYERTAGSSGFAGTWESTSPQSDSSTELRIERYDSDGLSFITPAEGITKNVKFDGQDHANAVIKELSSAGRRSSERALEVTDKLKGKIIDTEEIELSSDGKRLTMTTRQPGHAKPNILVFDRE